jgi:uncharacterized membrane protein YgaE (UPF0421/DUF939 family)
MMALLLDETKINQAKVDTNLNEIKKRMMTRLEDMIQASHDKMMAKLDDHHERMEALMDVNL